MQISDCPKVCLQVVYRCQLTNPYSFDLLTKNETDTAVNASIFANITV